ncbi:MAG: DUF1559 domain-containing protein [Pirellulaceae bacterium]|nr:DUF1559 domain-containing protein [Pirellulaceae bacterium]
MRPNREDTLKRELQRGFPLLTAWALLVLLAPSAIGQAVAQAPKKPELVREIFVPFDDLNVLLEGDVQRVFLTREQYEELLAQAKKTDPEKPAPHAALILSAAYEATIEDQRARLLGILDLEVLADGLQAVPLELSGVGLRAARLDDREAAIGRNEQGQAVLFVAGPGRFRLTLDLVTPLETSAAQQSLAFRVPSAPASQLRLTVPGNVEIKSGASVVRREVDETAGVTRFDLLLPREPVSLVMSLNNRLLRRQRVIVARSVLVDEVTAASERLHAAVSLGVLHGAVDRFRFVLPDGFEPTEVLSPLLSRWEVHQAEGRRELEVVLREPATDTVVLNLSATRTPAVLTDWTMPRLEPLDVAGQVALVGLVVDQQLQAKSLTPQGLIPVDHAVLTAALPDTVFRVEPGTPRVRTLAAFYAPGEDYSVRAQFDQPKPRLEATTNLLLVMDDTGHRVRGGFVLAPEVERLFELRFQGPPGWFVSEVTDADGNALPVERYEDAGGAPSVRVRLNPGVLPGEPRTVLFQAVHVPAGWLGDWQENTVEFPRFVIQNADRDLGAIAVRAESDLGVRPDLLENLVPLDENEKANYGLAGIASDLAYRYDGQPYRTTLAVRRQTPTVTARSYSFLQLAPSGLTAQYELVYDIREARTRRLSFVLPADTPASLSIQSLEGATVKEFGSETTDSGRRWTALLAEPAGGVVRLAVRFQQPLASEDQADYRLPLPLMENVAYQTAVVAVEGHADLDLEPKTDARRVDVGELAAAQYRAGRRLLGVYEFAGPPGDVRIDIRRRDGYGLPPAIVQRAKLETLVATSGACTTGARYLLRTKAPFLEIRLPDKQSRLWSALVDGRPMTPQTDGDSLLISLPATGRDAVRDLQIVYETPVAPLFLSGNVETAAPRLLLRSDRDAPPREVPTADIEWQLFLPPGHRLVRSFGTVETEGLPSRPSPVWTVAAILYEIGGGVSLLMPAELRMRSFSTSEATPPPATALYLADDMDSIRLDVQSGAMGAVTAEEFDMEALAANEFRREAAEASQPMAESAPVDQPQAPQAAPAPSRPAGPPTETPPPVVWEPKPEPAAAAQQAKSKMWALEGVRSLRIDLQPGDDSVTFRSLGSDPRLGATLVNQQQMNCLAWTVAGLVLALGIALTRSTARRKATLIVVVILAALALPPLTGWTQELGDVFDAAFFAACLLVPYYLAVALVRWACNCCCRCTAVPRSAATAAGTLLLLLPGTLVNQAWAQNPAPAFDPQPLIDLLLPPQPLRLPDDAVIIPYDPAQGDEGLKNATKVLVPYAKYIELWNRAYPDKRLDAKPPIVPYALAGAAYQATLAGGEFLELQGRLDIEVFSDQPVQVPLDLRGAVLSGARLDGQPARLQIVGPAAVAQTANAPAQMEQQVQQQARVVPAQPDPLVLLHVSGKGLRRLDLTVRIKLERRGGWRVAAARVPVAPAASLTLAVPAARTEVRLVGLADRGEHETETDGAQIVTALPMTGDLNLQWRSKVAEGQVDRSLTAESEAVLDVQEDGLRLAWRVNLLFPRSRRDTFTILLPDGYLVERVTGDNVRGWEWNAEQTPARLEITLLKEAMDSETVTLHLSQRGAVRADAPTQLSVPVVAVDGAMLHKGRITIRRSSRIDLRTDQTQGVSRTDVAADLSAVLGGGDAAEESPLGLLAYQAYQFAATPFAMQLTALPIPDETTAELQTLLRIAERETALETRVLLNVRRRPVHRVRLVVPQELKLEQVGPGPLDWAETQDNGRRLLNVYLEAGRTEPFSLVLSGSLGRRQAADPVSVPKFEVLDVASQQGDIVVQIDPAFNVRATELKNCESILLSRVFGWLQAAQRPLARLALRHSNPDYDARLEITPRQPRVSGFTVTNVKVTNIAVEETIVVDLTIQDAGIREVSFLVPAAMGQPRIRAPLLRQKTIEPAEDGWLRVRLQLQEETLGQYRVLVENDRLLTMADARQSLLQQAPIPVLEGVRTDQRYVTLEEAGRDELEIVGRENLQPLNRQQAEWRKLAGILGDGITQAFLVSGGNASPLLTYKTVQRATVQTAGAGIGLAEAFLIVDPSGAYRGRQIYHVYNTTEQFLEVQLPHAASSRPAELWTATVAGEAVKPGPVPNAASPGQVRIPLIKTAEGDRDYPVVLQYGGVLGSIHPVRGIDFPFIKTLNINVELSQVRLRLPESFRWVHFGGTMRQVTDEGDLAADFFDYNTRQVKRLMQVWNSENPYAKARVANNLKQLGLALQDYHDTYQQFGANTTLQFNYANNADVLSRAQQEAEQYFQQDAEVLATDNRGRLNTFFFEQKNSLARNVVTDLDGNFKQTVQPQAPGQAGDGGFHYGWLEKNKLDQRSNYSDEDLSKRFKDQAPEKAPVGKLGDLVKGKAVLQEGRERQLRESEESAQQVAQGEGQAQMAGQPQSQGVVQSQRDLARQYQQQLDIQTDGTANQPFGSSSFSRSRATGERDSRIQLWNGQQPADQGGQINGLALSPDSRRFAAPSNDFSDAPAAGYGGRGMGGMGGGMSGIGSGPAEVAFDPYAVPGAAEFSDQTHLASLDVELPSRGQEFFFTTPRGEVQIVAYGVSQPHISRLTQLLAVALGVAVLYVLYRVLLRVVPTVLRTIAGAVLLILLGLLSLIAMTFPVFGLVALGVGTVQLIRHSVHRKRPASQGTVCPQP